MSGAGTASSALPPPVARFGPSAAPRWTGLSALSAVTPSLPARPAFWVGLALLPATCVCSTLVSLAGFAIEFTGVESPGAFQATGFYLAGGAFLVLGLACAGLLVLIGRPRR